MFLFLDCETSGLPKRDLDPASPEQPWIVSVAAQLCDSEGNQLAALDTPIRANGRRISGAAEAVHGVSSAKAGRTGISEIAALAVICGRESFVSQARYIIGHGVNFDRQVIECVLARNGREAIALSRPGLTFFDTMTAATPFCRIVPEVPRDDGGWKWPTLDEACEILLGMVPRTGPHTAWNDLERCRALFFWLRDHNAVEMETAA